MLKRIKEFFYKQIKIKKKSPPKWLGIKTDDVVEYKFTIDGVDYFGFVGEMSLGNVRAQVAYGFIEEFHLRFTTDVFDAAYLAIKECLNKGNVLDAGLVLEELKARRDWVFEPISVLKVASVLFFDSSENPYNYDWEYNQKKIRSWLKVNDIYLGFFLRLPLIDSMIHLNLSTSDLRLCLNLMTESSKRMYTLLTNLSLSDDTRSELKKLLTFELEILKQLTSSD